VFGWVRVFYFQVDTLGVRPILDPIEPPSQRREPPVVREGGRSTEGFGRRDPCTLRHSTHNVVVDNARLQRDHRSRKRFQAKGTRRRIVSVLGAERDNVFHDGIKVSSEGPCFFVRVSKVLPEGRSEFRLQVRGKHRCDCQCRVFVHSSAFLDVTGVVGRDADGNGGRDQALGLVH